MRLVDPFLPAGSGFHQPFGVDLEGGGVARAQCFRHAVDAGERAVEILEVGHHHRVPQAEGLEVARQVFVYHGEFAGEIGFHVQVLVFGLYALTDADDVGNGGGRGDGKAVGIAHPHLPDARPQAFPVEAAFPVLLHGATAFRFQARDGIQGQDSPIPEAAGKTGIASAFLGQVGRGPISQIAHGFHRAVGECHRFLRSVGHAHAVQAIGKPHDAQPHGAMPQIGVPRLGRGIEIEIDHVVEHPHRRADGAGELFHVERAVGLQVRGQVDGTQVADGGFLRRRIERDLGAQVGAVHHAHMLLWRAQVAGILERDPGMPGLEDESEHPPPELHGGQLAKQPDFAARRFFLISDIGVGEGATVFFVQVGGLVGRKQRPFAVFQHPLHEEIGNPVRRVHVVAAAALVAGVLAQFEKFLDVQMPGLQIGAYRALALAALVDRHRRIVDHLEKGNHALTLAVGTLDAAAQRAHRRPVVAQAARELL